MWWLIGEYTEELLDGGDREAAAELLLAGARERSALVEAVFTGGMPDRDTLWEAAKLLRLPWEGVFVVVAVEAPRARPGRAAGRRGVPGRAGDRLGLAAAPDIQMGVVSLRHADALPVLLELLRRGVRARCGVSPAYPALGDTPRAVHYARLVLASLPAGAPAVAQFEETPLGVLAAAAPDAAGALVRTVLGPVLDLPDQERSSLLGAPCGRGSMPAARRPRPASGSTCTPTPSGTGCGGCRSTPDGPSTIQGPWPSCWPPWSASSSCRSRARPAPPLSPGTTVQG